MSGVAGRTNYSDWNKKTNSLLSELEEDERKDMEESKAALGQNGKYANSQSEANERAKMKEVSKAKQVLDAYKERELGVVQVLHSLLDDSHNVGTRTGDANDYEEQEQEQKQKESVPTRYVTRQDVSAGKRVLNLTDTEGPGHIILTQDLGNLKSQMPANSNTSLQPKSYPGDTENAAPNHTGGIIHGLIKTSISNVNDCTVSFHCKVITGLLEVSHCKNLTIKLCKDATVVTVQADLCQNLTIEFHDAPSGKGISSVTNSRPPSMYWGEDKDDRIFHAGVENMIVRTYRDGYVDLEIKSDYKKDGAKAVGNATAEEVQFVTSVVDGELVTERVLRQGSATGTTVTGAVGGGDGSSGARAMTAREMKEVEKRKEQIRKAVDERLGSGSGIKIMDKEGNDVPVVKNNKNDTDDNDNANANTKDATNDEIEEVYTGMSAEEIDSIVKDCEAQKTKGNEAFVACEYAQAVLLYTLTLDRAAELPDMANDTGSKSSSSKQLFPRHVVLSNRSAAFLKLGHHDKALADATKAVHLEPTYVKSSFRKGLALHAMGRYEEAISPLAAALKIEPKNKQIKQALQFAEVRMHQEMRKRMDR